MPRELSGVLDGENSLIFSSNISFNVFMFSIARNLFYPKLKEYIHLLTQSTVLKQIKLNKSLIEMSLNFES